MGLYYKGSFKGSLGFRVPSKGTIGVPLKGFSVHYTWNYQYLRFFSLLYGSFRK